MKDLKKYAISFAIFTVAITASMSASAGWRRVGGYGGSDIYPSLTGCTLGGWTCSEVRIKKTSSNVSSVNSNSGERKATDNDPNAEKIFCTDGKGNYKGAGNGCGGIWKPVEMGSK